MFGKYTTEERNAFLWKQNWVSFSPERISHMAGCFTLFQLSNGILKTSYLFIRYLLTSSKSLNSLKELQTLHIFYRILLHKRFPFLSMMKDWVHLVNSYWHPTDVHSYNILLSKFVFVIRFGVFTSIMTWRAKNGVTCHWTNQTLSRPCVSGEICTHVCHIQAWLL